MAQYFQQLVPSPVLVSKSFSFSLSQHPKFGTVVEERAGYHRGIVKGLAEGVEETAKRFKTLEWTRGAGTAQDYGAVVPGLILGIVETYTTVNCSGFVFELKLMLVSPATARRDCSTAGGRLGYLPSCPSPA